LAYTACYSIRENDKRIFLITVEDSEGAEQRLERILQMLSFTF
jgi:hypothetical protein